MVELSSENRSQDDLAELLSGESRQNLQQMLELIDPLCIITRIGSTHEQSRDDYGAIIHGELCRMKMLGLSDINAAKAVGLSARQLQRWCDRYPMLKKDLDRAAQLVNAKVAQLLFKMMGEKGPVGLNAIKFFLSTHAEEFRERAEVNLNTHGGLAELESAIRSVYGVDVSLKNERDVDSPSPDVSEKRD